jgi:hypothetical protein
LGDTYYKVIRNDSTASNILKCSFYSCLKEFEKVGDLKAHMMQHFGHYKYVCDHLEKNGHPCGKSFKTGGHLKTH